MKYLAYAASLAAANAASHQPLVELLQEQFENHFVQTEDGFKIDFAPYYSLDFESKNDIHTLSNTMSLDGHNDNTMECVLDLQEFPRQGSFKHSLEANFASLPIELNPCGHDDIEWDLDIDFSLGLESTFEIDHTLSMSSSDGSLIAGRASPLMHTAKMTVTTHAEIDNSEWTITTNTDLNNVLTGSCPASPLNPNLKSGANFSLGASTNIIFNVDQCDAYFADNLQGQCRFEFNSELSKDAETYRSSKLFLRLNPYTWNLIVALNRGKEKPYVLTIASDNGENNQAMENLNAYNFWSLKIHRGMGPRAKKAALLVLRWPMQNGWENNVESPLLSKWRMTYTSMAGYYAMDFADASIYSLFWFDRLISQIPEGEFDCTPIVEGSRIESEILVFFETSLSEFLTKQCRHFDNSVQEVVTDQELKNLFGNMQKYVRQLSSEASGDRMEQQADAYFSI